MVCTVKQGASIEIFKAGSPSEMMRTDILVEQSEFEALWERADGFVCVVVPSVGLGWVLPEFVECIERESLTSCISEQGGWYDTTFSLTEALTRIEDVLPLFSTIGRQLRSLTFDFSYPPPFQCQFGGPHRTPHPARSAQTAMQMIANHCVNLDRLKLNCASAAEISQLLDALNGDLGRRLLVLNLNGCDEGFSDVAAGRLATMLANADDLLVLQEVRLHNCGFDVQGLASLHEALQVNRTLALIELTGTKSLYRPGLELIRQCERVNAVYQGQLLQAAVPIQVKLAFLSVVTSDVCSDECKTSTALNALNQSLMSLVFGFAGASREVRRTIAWDENTVGRF